MSKISEDSIKNMKDIKNEKGEWFENPDFWNLYGPIMFDSQMWQEAPAVAHNIKELSQKKEGSLVMEAGCGIGRISTNLALEGYKVTGIDIIQSELDAARESALDEGLDINYINQDLRKLDYKDKFDLCVNVYNSFGYCDKIEDDILILKNIFNSLKDDGVFILECISRESAIMYFTEGEWFERAGWTVLTEFEVSGLWEGLISRWTLIGQNGERIFHQFVQRLYSAKELKDILTDIGFKSVEVYGEWDKSPYNQHARTMIIKATK